MPKKGDIARENVKNTIIQAFGEGFVAIQDKKIYVNSAENDEIFQFAISITMPKTPLTSESTVNNSEKVEIKTSPVELSLDDKQKVEELKQKLREKGVYQD